MAIEGIAKIPELRKRFLFVVGMLIVYRLACHVPTPGVNTSAIQDFFNNQSSGLLGMFNVLGGGALERFSICALGIMPYISSSIIFQLLTSVIPYLEALNKEGEQGRKKINQYSRYGTIVLAIIQGLSVCTFLQRTPGPGGTSLVLDPYVGAIPFTWITLGTLMAGTCFIMWLGEQMTEKGIGNGTSLIIFTGIVAGIPSAGAQSFQLISKGEMPAILFIVLLVIMVSVIGVIIFLEVGQRRIPIQYSQRVSGRKVMGGQSSHLPLKINFSNVIPPIFASSLLVFPATVASFWQNQYIQGFAQALNPGGILYNICFVGFIVFFCFFYTSVVFKTDDVAENLKKYGGFIPGIRAGKSTAEYIDGVLGKITVGGAIYLSVICVLPGILSSSVGAPFYFGGTSILIVVGVALDTVQQIQSYLITHQYEGFMKGAKIRGRRANL